MDNINSTKSHAMLLALYEYVRNMRKKQRMYFAKKDTVVLGQAKELERKVDASIRDIDAYFDNQIKGL